MKSEHDWFVAHVKEINEKDAAIAELVDVMKNARDCVEASHQYAMDSPDFVDSSVSLDLAIAKYDTPKEPS